MVEKITPERERAFSTYALLVGGLKALAESAAFLDELQEAGPESVATYERFALYLSDEEVEELDRRVLEILDEYVARIAGDAKLARKMKIVVDSGNGIPGASSPQATYPARLEGELEKMFSDDVDFEVHYADGAVIAAVSVSGPVERTSRQPGRKYRRAVVETAGPSSCATRRTSWRTRALVFCQSPPPSLFSDGDSPPV